MLDHSVCTLIRTSPQKDILLHANQPIYMDSNPIDTIQVTPKYVFQIDGLQEKV